MEKKQTAPWWHLALSFVLIPVIFSFVAHNASERFSYVSNLVSNFNAIVIFYLTTRLLKKGKAIEKSIILVGFSVIGWGILYLIFPNKQPMNEYFISVVAGLAASMSAASCATAYSRFNKPANPA